jgi:hypothetical protein
LVSPSADADAAGDTAAVSDADDPGEDDPADAATALAPVTDVRPRRAITTAMVAARPAPDRRLNLNI